MRPVDSKVEKTLGRKEKKKKNQYIGKRGGRGAPGSWGSLAYGPQRQGGKKGDSAVGRIFWGKKKH